MPIGIATVLHFLVDGLCVCMLFLMAPRQYGAMDVTAMFLTYNVLAFMTQPFTGWWVDRLRKRHTALVVAAGFLTLAVLLQAAVVPFSYSSPLLAFASAVLLGMGNSLFHVWGGKLTAMLSANDMRALGIFVSTGVLGLTLGVLYASWWMSAGMLTLIILLSCILPEVWSEERRVKSEESELHSGRLLLFFTLRSSLFTLLAILIFVFLRSFVGEVAQVGIDKTSQVLLLLAVTAMLGKAFGGWVARWWGIGPSIVVCLGIAAACMMWRGEECVPLLPVVAGVFAINCTMPMTLCLANRLFPCREGLSFGLLAAVLVPGYLLAKNVPFTSDHSFMLSALLLTIAVEVGMLLFIGERRRKVLLGAVAVNILTNVPLNYFLLAYDGGTGHLIAGELLVLVAEAVWYYFFVRQWQKAIIYSLLCNATSFLFGVLLQYIIIYSL